MMSKENSRPRSVSVISWFLIINGGLGAVAMIIAGGTVGKGVVALGLFGSILSVVCGAAMLARKNWARLLYVYGTPLSFLAEGIALGFSASQVVQLSLYGVIVYFLSREAASLFFGGPLLPGRYAASGASDHNINWSLVCDKCDSAYTLGENAFLVTQEDLFDAAMLNGGSFFGGQTSRTPDLAMHAGAPGRMDKEKVTRKALEICSSIERGDSRTWYCHKCNDGREKPYPGQWKRTYATFNLTPAEKKMLELSVKGTECSKCHKQFNLGNASSKTSEGQTKITCPHCGGWWLFKLS